MQCDWSSRRGTAVQPQAWEPPYATGEALEGKEEEEEKKAVGAGKWGGGMKGRALSNRAEVPLVVQSAFSPQQ